MESRALISAFSIAVRELLDDAALRYADPGEPAITSRLTELLRPQFPDWSVHHNWDRKKTETKRLRAKPEDPIPGEDALIIPDVIVHRVGKKENLLVVEAKKSTNRDFGRDIWKLTRMTEMDGDYAYAVGIHLLLEMKGRSASQSTVYTNGEIDEELTGWLRAELQAGERPLSGNS